MKFLAILFQNKLMQVFLFFLLMIAQYKASAQKLKINEPKIEYQTNPLNIEVPKPRFSWKIYGEARNTKQVSYEIKVSAGKDISVKNVIWHSHNKFSDESNHITYEGPSLLANKRYYWQVRIKDNYGNTSPWSEVQFWQMGLNHSDWSAQWITIQKKDSLPISPVFRKEVALRKNIRFAMAHITAKGLYEASINGKRVGDSYFTPGWTSYNKRLQYQTYDISELLKTGSNVIAVTLGDGWYKGNIGFNQRNNYGDTRALLLQIEVEYTDGTKQIISSDASWKSSHGPILSSDIYNGEIYDARLEKPGWESRGYKEDSTWSEVKVLDSKIDVLVSSTSPPVKKHEQFKPQKIFITPKGETVVDFGQNLVGWVKLKATGTAGTKITISHAEVLDKSGNFYVENLRAAKQQNVYILKDSDEHVFEPHFTFQGFRYVKLEGYPGKLQADDLTAIAVYSDMKPTGSFSTSNSLLNQLQQNIQWSQKGNFLDVPTDCPQRDERLGWTGDAQVFFKTAAYNMDVAGFFGKWLKDLKADQLKNGNIPFVIPNILGEGAAGSAGWGDVATVIPWDMYMAYGDKRILEEHYDSMEAWVNFISVTSKDYLWNSGHHFGDWLFYSPADDVHGGAAVTDKFLIAQTYYANSIQLLINTSELLGKKENAERYKLLLKQVKDAFLKEYLTSSGRLVSGTQTAYVLALQFDMLPEELRAGAAQRLVNNVRAYGNHLTTGFLGTPYLCHVLSRFGYTDVAYDLLLQETYPSWLYPVKKGATTIWERWDGIRNDDSFQNIEMNSFNHYAYGAVGDWMYRNLAGISPDESAPGYKKIRIAPKPGGNLTSAHGELTTMYGLIKSAWKVENEIFKCDVVIPVNTTAIVILPYAALKDVTENSMAIQQVKGITKIRELGENVEINLGSGAYHFQYKITKPIKK
jgi:alpha-L-rhamnosidase